VIAANDRRFAAWLDLIADLLSTPRTALPHELIAAELDTTFDANVAWHWLDPDGSFGFESSREIPGWPTPDVQEFFAHGAMTQHPLLAWYATTGDPTPTTTARVPDELVTPTGSVILNDILKPPGLDHQLSIPYQLDGYVHRTFLLSTTGSDFPPEHVSLAGQLRPLLCLLDRQTTALERLPSGEGPSLTGREAAVLQLLTDGLTAQSIAFRLGISPRTVHKHLEHLYTKLGVRDRLQAVIVAQRYGLLDAVGGADGEQRPQLSQRLSGR